MKDVRITKQDDGSYDLLMEDGRFQWAEDGTEAAQHSVIRLQIVGPTTTADGELSLNGMLTEKVNLGTRTYDVLFDMTKSQAEKELELKRRILGTPGITKITDWSWTQTADTVFIVGKGLTDWGEIDISAEISIL